MSKSACARDLNLSRSTVIKWWNAVDWEGGDQNILDAIVDIQESCLYGIIYNDFDAYDAVMDNTFVFPPAGMVTIPEIAQELNLPIEKVELIEKVRQEVVKMNGDYDLQRSVREFVETEIDFRYTNRRSKAIWKGRRRWKR